MNTLYVSYDTPGGELERSDQGLSIVDEISRYPVDCSQVYSEIIAAGKSIDYKIASLPRWFS